MLNRINYSVYFILNISIIHFNEQSDILDWFSISSLSYDVASGSEITPCIKIDKPLVIYRFLGLNNVAYIMAK